MAFRGNSSSVSRRRRVFTEESPSRAGGSSRSPSAARSSSTKKTAEKKRYSSCALDSVDVRLTHFIPIRRLTLAITFLLGLIAITALLSLYSQQANWAAAIGFDATSAINLSGQSHLGTWLSTSALLISALYSVIIFAVRRHRADDYRGRYSVWLWASLAFLIASIDATAGIHRLVQGILAGISEREMPWWILAYALVYGTLGIRLIIETRSSRGTMICLVTAGLFYGVSCLLSSQILDLGNNRLQVYAQSFAILTGHLLVCYSTLVYARHVFLDAQGRLMKRREARMRKRAAKAEATQEKQLAKNLAPEKKTTVKVSAKKATKAANGKAVARKSDSKETAAENAKPKFSLRFWRTSKRQEDDQVDESKPNERRKSRKARGTAETQTVTSDEPRKKKVAAVAKVAPEDDEKLRSEVAKRKKARLVSKEQTPAKSAEVEPDGMDELEGTIRLSKSERKRLRKEKRRQKRAA